MVVFWNAALERMPGLPARRVLGRPLWDVQLESDVDDLLTLLNRADLALYHAKQTGRNRCVLWNDDIQQITGDDV